MEESAAEQLTELIDELIQLRIRNNFDIRQKEIVRVKRDIKETLTSETKITCPLCKGIGKQPGQECAVCDGKGKIG